MVDPKVLREWGAIATSVLVAAAFLTAFVVAYFSKDQTNLGLLVGAVIAMMSNVVGYYLGSSAGSARKDEVLGDLAAKPPLPIRPLT